MTTMRCASFAFAVAASAWALLLSCDRSRPSGEESKRTRVVLVTIDTLRFDSFARERTAMPRSLAFARRGAVFLRAYAASNVTQPTHASLFTSLHPWQHGVVGNGIALDDRWITVAEEFREAGYRTAAVVSSFPVARRFGFAQGFEIYREVFDRDLYDTGRRVWEGVDHPDTPFYALARHVTAEAVALLDELQDRRQFVWVHFFDPHDPYGDAAGSPLPASVLLREARKGGAAYRRVLRRARDLYHEDVRALDVALGTLFERLDAEANADGDGWETHVVVTSDHGESLGEQGQLGHGGSLAPRETQVPLFVVSPRVEPALRHDVAGSIDVRPTLLALGGVDPRSETAGRDLTRVPVGERTTAVGMQRRRRTGPEAEVPRDRFFVARPDGVFAGHPGAIERVDRRRNAGVVPAEDVSQLFARFEAAAQDTADAPALSDETRRGLEALGYLSPVSER